MLGMVRVEAVTCVDRRPRTMDITVWPTWMLGGHRYK